MTATFRIIHTNEPSASVKPVIKKGFKLLMIVSVGDVEYNLALIIFVLFFLLVKSLLECFVLIWLGKMWDRKPELSLLEYTLN